AWQKASSGLRAAVQRVRDMPNAWQVLTPGVRRRLLTSFPYGVIYSVDAKTVTVISVAHLHREPGTLARPPQTAISS
ncbi:MAG: hypothetical protein SGJ17_11125, partial [Hyphomicrobiales bacterium]|nr:hypothetical protein [Hyphomicrobiales bacterium]